MQVSDDHLHGRRLYGNDLSGPALEQWYADEAHGFSDLVDGYATASGDLEIDTVALNRAHAALLPRRSWGTCLVLGCANGQDILSLGLSIERIVAIEPGERWWTDRVGSIPAEFRMPTLTGDIDLPDGSVDLVVGLGVLHHIATVEHVVAELGRVLRPGGAMLIREPMTSMGDFRTRRRGLTIHERGIPAALMKRFIADAGLSLRAARPCTLAVLLKAAKKMRLGGHDSRAMTWLDAQASRAMLWNARYWRPRLIDKFAPNSMVYVAQKEPATA